MSKCKAFYIILQKLSWKVLLYHAFTSLDTQQSIDSFFLDIVIIYPLNFNL